MLAGMAGGTQNDYRGLENPGFHYPLDYVCQTFQLWYYSDFQVMPAAGGINNQDPQWLADMTLILRLKSARETLKAAKKGKEKPLTFAQLAGQGVR